MDNYSVVNAAITIVQPITDLCIFTARKRSLGQGNIFAPVCHSVHSGGGVPRQVPPGQGTPPGPGTPPRARYTPQTRYTPGSSAYWEIRATSGRYASYWNAFLYKLLSHTQSEFEAEYESYWVDVIPFLLVLLKS